MFMKLAAEQGGIAPLLDHFFSFLHRKTDFYVVDKNPSRQMGFAPGAAERLLLRSFRKFPQKAPMAVSGGVPAAPSGNGVSPGQKGTLRIVEVDGGRKSSGTQGGSQSKQRGGLSAAASAAASATAAATATSGTAATASSCGSAVTASPASAQAAPTKTEEESKTAAPKYTEDGKQMPVGNGGVTEKYSWTQTLEEVTITAPVPAGTRGKEVEFRVKRGSLYLGLKRRGGDAGAGEQGGGGAIIDGALGGPVKPSECLWTVEDRKRVVVTLAKATRVWWRNAHAGGEEIDTTKVDSTQHVSEYDEETQGAIRKIVFDQRQKARGLPTSDELSAQEMLEKYKHLPGSPFLKGEAGAAENRVKEGTN